MIGNKIKTTKSEALYNVLIGTLGVSDDYYEKETFIYHHSICDHHIQEYVLNTPRDFSTKWSFNMCHINNWITCENKIDLDSNSLLEQKVILEKANILVKYILEN